MFDLSDFKKSQFYREIANESKREGRRQSEREIAKNLLRRKKSLKFISDVTGLPAKQIRALTKDLTRRKN